MEEAKKLLGSVAISQKIIEEVQAQVKDIGGFKKKILGCGVCIPSGGSGNCFNLLPGSDRDYFDQRNRNHERARVPAASGASLLSGIDHQ